MTCSSSRQRAVAAAKIGYREKKLILNPSNDDLKNSELELIVAGTKEGVLMVESEVKELSEKIMLDAVMFAHKEFQPIIKFIDYFAKEKNPTPLEYKDENTEKILKDVYEKIKKEYESKIKEAYNEKDKSLRSEKLSIIRNDILEKFVTKVKGTYLLIFICD